MRHVRERRDHGRRAEALAPTGIVISPGPARPTTRASRVELIRALRPDAYPILGVCLGHQAIVQAFGGEVGRARALMHGKTSPDRHDGRGVFAGLPSRFEAARYHSLVARDESAGELEITARTADGEIMGVRHRTYPVEGVQFHPESVLTPLGPKMAENFLATARRVRDPGGDPRPPRRPLADTEQARETMGEIMRGESTPAQIGALLVALHIER